MCKELVSFVLLSDMGSHMLERGRAHLRLASNGID